MKRTVSLLLCLVLLLGVMSMSAFAAAPENVFPVRNPSAMLIAGAVDNEIDRIYDDIGKKSTLYFPFSPAEYESLEQFRDILRRDVLPLMNALFSADMAGRDYITVRSAYGASTLEGKAQEYYYIVTLQVYGNAELRREMDSILKKVKGDTPREQVLWLQNYLFTNIVYDDDTLSSSGTQLALMEGRGVCMGYTRAMLELCRRLNIPCFCVVNDTHMWNSVYLEGSWQMLDATWNIPLCDVIDGDEHEYDASLYRKTVTFIKNRVHYKGKAAGYLMEDIEAGWYRSAVEYCLGAGLFKGVTHTRFAPDEQMTRGMFVTVLGRLAGAKERHDHGFADVKKGSYYAGFVGWAKESGIVNGVSDTRFAPDEPITREQLCKMMAGFAKVQGTPLAEPSQKHFADHDLISKWARRSVYRCAAAGLVQGKGKNRFDPLGSATRAEVAVILHNYGKFIEN